MKKNVHNDLFADALITGADGMVGSYIDFGTHTNHRTLDVTDLKEVLATCKRHMPKLIIHLAAETDFDRCERDITNAYAVNAVGTYNVACAAREIDAKLVYISTSAVFDGKKDGPYQEKDIPRPQNHYGHSKYLGELAVSAILDNALIVRICWVFGGGPSKDQKFVAKILKQLNQSTINVVSDKHGSPTYGKDLVAGIKRLVEEGKSGIYHMGNDGSPTRADVAREIVRITNSMVEVKEVDESFFSTTYVDRLNNESMTAKVSYMRPWQEALAEYINEEWDEHMQVNS